MAQFTITLSDEEEKALLTDMKSIQEYLENAIFSKARRCIDNIVETVSDKRADRMTVEEKKDIVRTAEVETAVERGEKLFHESIERQKI